MNNTEKNFIQNLKDIRLDGEAKLRIREQLVAYSELHSMPAVEEKPFNGVSFISSMFGHSRRLLATTLALALLLVGGGASTFAAEKAVPGDVLYPVKVGINEPVAAVFAGSGEAQARHHARLAVRRVQEAEVLRARGALTPETEEELSAKIDAETTKVIEEAGKLSLAGDVSASVAVRTDLAGELAPYAPVADTVAASAPEATTMMAKAVRATLASVPSEDEEVGTPRTVREVLGKKLVLLRVSQDSVARVRTIATDDTPAKEKKEGKKHSMSSLLFGSSVSEQNNTATSTATNTPELGKKFLEQLIRPEEEHKETPASNEQESHSSESGNTQTSTQTPSPTPTPSPASMKVGPIKVHIGL